MTTTDAPKDGATICADLVRTHDFVRYAPTLFVPGEARRALLSICAFNVEVSRVHELVSQPLPGEMRLQWWTDMLAGTEHGSIEGNPVAAELLHTIREHRLPVSQLSRLVEEHQFDLYNDPMPTLAALEDYLDATASALFVLAARVMARPSEAIDHLARHAGLAQGMAQVIASLGRDASRQQLFLPLQILQQHGSSTEEVFAGKPTPAIRASVAQLAGEAQSHLKTAFDLLADVPPEARRVFLPLAHVRRELARMASADYDPFVPKPASRLRVLWTLWRAARTREFGG
ncbi:squalene/phytoene synthase family protein [Bradyrhizobium tropiciagri]|uniref:phytoene/squalene synthase family protein n=1 Tax=Bradyrhizobium tropiciagri TaxID=312253 RepID=UPI001BA7A482|nr:phytoene/squalene synthase family protein [Bradyrhizobium tropiciagri]MBR0872608.1 squalene/phytoene synthase family protein [Bradyrhizobium tropiciagri]